MTGFARNCGREGEVCGNWMELWAVMCVGAHGTLRDGVGGGPPRGCVSKCVHVYVFLNVVIGNNHLITIGN